MIDEHSDDLQQLELSRPSKRSVSLQGCLVILLSPPSIQMTRSATSTGNVSSNLDSSSAKSSLWNPDHSSSDFEVEAPNFDSFHVALTMTSEDLELAWLQFRIPSKFVLELAGHSDRIVEPPSGRIGLYKESFQVELRLPLHFFIVELLNLFKLHLILSCRTHGA